MQPSRASLLLIATSGCVLGPFDLDEIDTMASRPFSGYSQTASSTIRVLAFNQFTQQWVQIATAVSSSSPDIPAGMWAGNPNLYSWTTNASLSTCFLNPQCTPRIGTIGASTVRLKFEEGSASSPTRLIVFDEHWNACMGERTQRGESFNVAAFNCRAPSFPELRLTVVEDWAVLGRFGPTGALGTGHPDENRIVTGASGSNVLVTFSPQRGTWTPWSAIPGGPAVGLRTDVAPMSFIHTDTWWPPLDQRELIAAGNDGLLYRSLYDEATNTFAPLQAITGLSGVTGRVFGVKGAEGTSLIAHAAGPNTVQLSSILDGAFVAGMTFTGTEATIGDIPCCDGAASVVAVRNGTEISIWAVADGLFSTWFQGSFDAGNIEDMSAPIVTRQRNHLFVARPTPWGYGEIVHFEFPSQASTEPFSVTTRVAGTYTPGGAPARLAAAWEDAVVVAWRDAGTGLRAARFMPAVGTGVWQSYTVGTTATLSGRPAMLQMNSQLPYTDPYHVPGYDRGIEVAALGSDLRARFASLTKVMQRGDLEHHFDVYTTEASSGCGSDPNVVDPVWLEDLAEHDRFALSYVGDFLWSLPVTLTDYAFRTMGRRQCAAGGVQPASAHRACELARTPLVLSTVAPHHTYVCNDGIYFSREMTWWGFGFELGSVLARAMGINNNGAPPEQWNVNATNIPLAALQEAAVLFAERTGQPCVPRSDGSCRGFAMVGGDEDDGPEQALAGAMWMYRHWRTIGGHIADDLAQPVCDDLLARKYFWLKEHVFHGYEYVDPYEWPIPPPALCP